ncbi:MAG: UDP-N-acetylmuramate dehydrogenase [Saprospiraceae bacterium]|nr:UDP-N-acetylmuramate dehydrogenase [Saprospiraceae bacterium]
MKIENQVSLLPYNSFALPYLAKNLIRIHSEDDVLQVIKQKLHPLRILGGGSNILLTQDIDGFLLKNEIKGLDIVEEDEENVVVEVASGENWHSFVMWTLEQNFGGLENLSLIPGTTGAAPIQNIGAYGIEQKNLFYSLTAIHLERGEKKIFEKDECSFGYRDSIFKNIVKDQYFITAVRYQLKKKNHTITTQYGDIQSQLLSKNITKPNIQDISEAVISIRESKLPDPKKIGNAGSFFKNPVISLEFFKTLLKKHPDIPYYNTDDKNSIKIPAGWMIEKLGFKGMEIDGIGVHKKQALVLVNYGHGKGESIVTLAELIQDTVKENFSIELHPEVNIW